ncbi:MAG: response regulator [Candidatus Zixiibacteriota bacterium]|nr:MAG: response regulator [candidate division Zixibacteria bacterium]
MSYTVLVVDDSATIVKFVSFSLRNKGFHVITACDGMDALEKLSRADHEIDLVITDLNMPNLDGYGLIAALRENEQYSRTPIIILSSEEGEEDKARGLSLGATSYLVKPFKQQVLIDEVNKHVVPAGTTGVTS